MRSLLFPLLFAATLAAQDRAEVVNRSGQAWTLALLEGSQPRRGSLALVDKFSGHTLATLAKAGDKVEIPPHGRFLAIYNRDGGYLFLGFILKDPFGWYAEYRATVEYLSSPRITVVLVDHHLGPPLDRAAEGEVRQRLDDLLEVGSDNIIIHPNSLGSPPDEARKFDFPQIPGPGPATTE